MPKRRKSEKYVSHVAVLLRDAQPTWRELHPIHRNGKSDIHKQRECIHACKLAADELLKMYWTAKRHGTMAQLDIRVRNFCERMKAGNGGVLPKPKGGRPTDVRHRFLIAVEVQEARDTRGRKYGSLEQALQEVSKRRKISYDHVKDSYDGRGARFVFIPFKEWRLAVKAEVALRKENATVDKSVKG
jgi:hypothetical protein